MANFSMNFDGLDALLDRIERKIAYTGPLEGLFTDEFMRSRYTYGTFADFLAAVPPVDEFPNGDLSRSTDGWDAVIAEQTSFGSWAEMVGAGHKDLMSRRESGETPYSGDLG